MEATTVCVFCGFSGFGIVLMAIGVTFAKFTALGVGMFELTARAISALITPPHAERIIDTRHESKYGNNLIRVAMRNWH